MKYSKRLMLACILIYAIGCSKGYAQVKKLLQKANTYMGVPYKWGGTGYSGIDCSGFTMMSFRAIGIYLPRVSRQQANYWKGKTVSMFKVRAGDLIFFSDSRKHIDHVGIIVRVVNRRIFFIHSSSTRGGVAVDELTGMWRDIYRSCVRVIHHVNDAPSRNNSSQPVVPKAAIKLPQRELSDHDLLPLPPCSIKILKNMYYAKYGYRFKTKTMQRIFQKMSWYRNMQKTDYSSTYIFQHLFTPTERRNVLFLKKHEGSCP